MDVIGLPAFGAACSIATRLDLLLDDIELRSYSLAVLSKRLDIVIVTATFNGGLCLITLII